MSKFKLIPVWGRLIVKPDDIEDTDPMYKKAKAAGLDLSHITSQDREQFSQMSGTIMAVGGNCFEHWRGAHPAPGHKVLYDKYAGCTKEIEGVKYRIISDTDILVILDERE